MLRLSTDDIDFIITLAEKAWQGSEGFMSRIVLKEMFFSRFVGLLNEIKDHPNAPEH